MARQLVNGPQQRSWFKHRPVHVGFVAGKMAKTHVFSILCLTTHPIHQGQEKRKKSVTSARSPRNTSAQLRDR